MKYLISIALSCIYITAQATQFGDIPASQVIGSLSRTNDTNVTLTLGGTPTDALLKATSLTLGWSGQLALSRGGTAASLTDPAADTLMGWDDTDNAVKFLTIGTGLTYTHSSHTLSATNSGNVSNSGTPTVGQMAQWTNATTIKGVTLSGSGATMSINTSGVLTISGIADASLTNPQTYAAIVPNTAPSAGQILIGNAGNTAYAKNTVSGSGATISLGSTGTITISGIANASLSNSAITIAGTSTSLGGAIALDTITGVSSNGFLTRTGTNTLTNTTAPSGAVVGTTDTQTLTNKWVKPRATATPAPGATPAVNTDSFDLVSFTSLGTAITSMTTSLTGTPVTGQKLLLGFKDDGTARAITWGASFQSGPATLLATTVISKQHWVGLIYDGTKWTCFASDATGY